MNLGAAVDIAILIVETGKTMTARDVTELYAFFSARKTGKFLHILG